VCVCVHIYLRSYTFSDTPEIEGPIDRQRLW